MFHTQTGVDHARSSTRKEGESGPSTFGKGRLPDQGVDEFTRYPLGWFACPDRGEKQSMDPKRDVSFAINHVGLSVPDLDAAQAWYQEVLGFHPLTPPTEMRADDPGLGPALEAMLGAGVKAFRMAHLTMGNGVGLQVFEFLEPHRDAHVSRRRGLTRPRQTVPRSIRGSV